MSRLDALARVEVASAEELRAWLLANHGQAESVWLVTWRKHVAGRHVAYDAVVDEAVAFGWIDSLPRKLDADRTMLLLSPRKPGSAWSAVNKARVERLRAAGRMHPAGERAVGLAVATGAWAFLDDVERLEVPADLEAAFDRHPGARERFAAFSRSSRRGILEWVKQARAEATRARRVEETARLAAAGLRANFPEARRGAAGGTQPAG